MTTSPNHVLELLRRVPRNRVQERSSRSSSFMMHALHKKNAANNKNSSPVTTCNEVPQTAQSHLPPCIALRFALKVPEPPRRLGGDGNLPVLVFQVSVGFNMSAPSGEEWSCLMSLNALRAFPEKNGWVHCCTSGIYHMIYIGLRFTVYSLQYCIIYIHLLHHYSSFSEWQTHLGLRAA